MNAAPIQILLVEDNPADARLIQEALSDAGVEQFSLSCAARLDDALKDLRPDRFDAILLDLSLPDSQGLDTLLAAHAQAPGVPILVLTGLDDQELAMTAVKYGAQDYIVKGETDGSLLARSIRFAIARQRIARGQSLQASPVERGKVLGLFGAKGGVGVTTVALNLGTLLARQKKSAIVLELRPFYGTLTELTGRTPVENLRHLLELDPGQIDARALRARLVQLARGPRVLYGPQMVEDFKEIAPEQARAIVEGLSRAADYTIIDLPCVPSQATEAAVKLCDFVALVLEAEPACLSAAKVGLKLLQSWGAGGGQVGAIVINRTVSPFGLKPAVIKSELGCEIIGVIPTATEACARAQRLGVPLVDSQPDHAAAMNLTEIANRLAAERVVPISL